MKFEISTHCESGEVERTPVGWIKQFREETGAGLKQAKDVCDILRNHFGGSLFGKTVVLDTTVFGIGFPERYQFRYSDVYPIRSNGCSSGGIPTI